MKKHFSIVFFISLALQLASTPAKAALVQFAFTGAQFSVDDAAGAPAGSYFQQASGLSVISGILQFDTNALTPQGSSPIFQAYAGPIDILLDQFSTANPDTPINLSSVVDQAPGVGGDQFGGNFDGAYTNGVGFYDTVSFQFFDSTGTAFSSQSLPSNLSLSDFTSLRIFISTRFFDGNNANSISTVTFSLTSLTTISDMAVPLPGAIIFFLTGAAGLFLSRRKSSLQI